LELVSREKDKEIFKALNGDCGEVSNLGWILTGVHTKGSISLFHKLSKALFIGDIICFFGVPLPPEGMVSEAQELRELWYELVSSGGLAESLNAQNIEIEAYKASIKRLVACDAEYLCSGHGVVLKQDIQKFLNRILEAVR
jgi:glyoxylase-like metal-dependent hydrolase (beta-lactamase superfamily II)